MSLAAAAAAAAERKRERERERDWPGNHTKGMQIYDARTSTAYQFINIVGYFGSIYSSLS